jgi:hypothetical protein
VINTCPMYPIFLPSVTVIIFGKQYNVWRSSWCNFPNPHFSCPVGPNIIPFPNT